MPNTIRSTAHMQNAFTPLISERPKLKATQISSRRNNTLSEKGLLNASISDTQELINIISQLQFNYRIHSVVPLFHKLEKLLNISNICVGVYEPNSREHTHLVGTGNGEKTDTEIQKLAYHFENRSTSVSRNNRVQFFCYYEDRLSVYLQFDLDTKEITNGQKQLITIIRPYLYATAYQMCIMYCQFVELNLTLREQEVMEWVKEGKDNWAISKILDVSERTVKFHVCNLLKKLGVSSRVEVICWYHRMTTSMNESFQEHVKSSGLLV